MPFSKPSIVTKALVSVAICFASSAPAYANAACQPGSGCALPVRDPPPVVSEPVAVIEEDGGGWGIWPILGVVALVALAAFLLLDDDDDEEPVSP